MRVARKKWLNYLNRIAKLVPASKTEIVFSNEGAYISEPTFRAFFKNPDSAPISGISVGMADLIKVFQPLTEQSVGLFNKGDHLQFLESQSEILLPFTPNATIEKFQVPEKLLALKEFPLTLEAMSCPIKDMKSTGLAEYIYWERDKLYSYNGTMLAVATYQNCPVPRILIPKSLARFTEGLDKDDEDFSCRVGVLPDGTVHFTFGDLGWVQISQPPAIPMDWTQLTPTGSVHWMSTPSLLFKLPAFCTSLTDKAHANVRLTLKNRMLTAENVEAATIPFKLTEKVESNQAYTGVVDVGTIFSVLPHSQQMGWGDKTLVFSSHNFKFYCAMKP